MRVKRMSFSELVKRNKREIMDNQELLDRIEDRIENRAQKKLTEVNRSKRIAQSGSNY